MDKQEDEKQAEVFADNMKQQLTDYLQLRLDLLKADFTEKTALIFSKLITGVIVLVMLFMVLIFGSLVMGFYFGNMLGSLMLGFAVVTGFYVLLIVLVLLVKDKLIQAPVANQIIDIMYESDEA
ncbi:MAG: phage holin family protein [Bacteroidota bacterium]